MPKMRVIHSRLAQLRNESNYTQAEVMRLLKEYTNGQSTASISQYSSWECGRRSVPQRYIEPLANIFDVTIDYLCGLSSDKDGLIQEKSILSRDEEEIAYEQLHLYDKQPIFLVFLNYEHENAWGIYDHSKNTVNCLDYEYKISINQSQNVRFYAFIPRFVSTPPSTIKAMDILSMLSYSHVYIEVNSSDKNIQKEYNGWYKHNETRTALINAKGLILPYDGLNYSYTAYHLTD